MSQASSSKVCKNGVFLSFRGPDTRTTFTSHLYNALVEKGIDVFKDDEWLETGKSIPIELLKAIEDSRFAVVIFSKGYASSRWCLEELAHILKCKKIVIPVFYKVNPTDVRHQNAPFAKSFSIHEKKYKDDMEKVQSWRDAFAVAGNLKGHHLQNYKDEGECIKKVVDEISSKPLHDISPFSESVVGKQSRIEKVISLLDIESNDHVHSVGIWGMSGIGKTEIAWAIYEEYRHKFDAGCFLDVGLMYQKKGITGLQQALIRELLGIEKTITSERVGAAFISSRLRQKKVLIILDDVNHLNQLKFLVEGLEWFGRGSRILVSTVDKRLLNSHVKEDKVYEVPLLSKHESLQLFCKETFGRESPDRDLEELSCEVVKYADGLPLALIVLSSSLCGLKKDLWVDTINKLKKIPKDEILKKLRIGLDGLDKYEMRIFLDIACLYNHRSIYYVEPILKSCGIHHLIGISRLIEKSLLSIKCGRITMHNLIREMGENVLREEYANSRIWLPEEVHKLFVGELETKKVESLLIPKGYSFDEDDHVNHSKVFEGMQSLEVLILDDETICSESTVTSCLPSSLRWIEWPNYPASSLPDRLEPSNLVGLVLFRSRIVQLWPISKKLSNLKHLDLRESLGLTKTPNFGDLQNLETLDLRRCKNLEEVHPSLGHCRMLTYLDFSGCVKLKKLPKFGTMESLGTLKLLQCTSLEELQEICGDMQRLSRLYVGSPWIRSLPPCLSGLNYLALSGCEVLESIPDAIRNLEVLYISGCNKLATLPNSIFESQQLKYFCIYRCSGLAELPVSLGVQKELHLLEIDRCENLKKLPSSIQMESLYELKISNCPKLDTFPKINGDMHCLGKLTLNSTGIRELPSSIGNLRSLKSLNLKGCEDLVSLPNSLCNLKNLQYLILCGCKKLEKLPENIGDLQELSKLDARETAISQPPPSSAIPQVSSCINYQVYPHLYHLDLLGGLPEDLGSLQYLRHLNVSGSNISCLPKSIKELLCLVELNVQFCQNLDELPGELPQNLRMLYVDYHLALKSIRDLVTKCLVLSSLSISWCGHEKSEYGTISTCQVNMLEFIQRFLKTCIQCDFYLRDYFLISFPKVRIPELFGYQVINQKEISIELNPSWYTNEFMGFSICCYPDGQCGLSLLATFVCKSDPEKKHVLKHELYVPLSQFSSVDMCYIYIPLEKLRLASVSEEGKNPNDYCLFEVSTKSGIKETCWGIRLEYEKKVGRWRRKQRAAQSPKLFPVPRKDDAVTTLASSLRLSSEHNIATDRGLHLGNENKDLEVDQAAMAVQKEHESQNIVELTRVCDSTSREMGDASRERNKKRKISGTNKHAWFPLDHEKPLPLLAKICH